MTRQKPIDMVRSLQSAIKEAQCLIEGIQRDCQHRRKRHMEHPDSHAGWWSGYDTCMDCGMRTSSWTRPAFGDEKPITAIIKK